MDELQAFLAGRKFEIVDPSTHNLPRIVPTVKLSEPVDNAWYWWAIEKPEIEAIILGGGPEERFFLAHEIGHATGASHRLGRKSLAKYRFSKTALRCEESIADGIAEIYGEPRRSGFWYTKPTPGSRAAQYVEQEIARARTWLNSLPACACTALPQLDPSSSAP